MEGCEAETVALCLGADAEELAGLGDTVGLHRLAFLNRLVRAWHERVPFHNVSLLAASEAERAAPTTAEIDATIQTGGLCFSANVCMQRVLCGLGFCARLRTSVVTTPGNHVVVLVDHVCEEGDCYLVEVACGFPTWEAVPMNLSADGDCVVFTHGFLEYRYIRRAGEKLVVRQHRRGDSKRPICEDAFGRPGETDDGWRRFYDFELGDAMELAEITRLVTPVYTVKGTSPFLVSLRAIRWVNDRLVGIKDDSLILEKDGVLEATKLASVTAIAQAFAQYFPELPQPLVDRALRYWQDEIQCQ
eukprot:TRINITY_DN69797_c0_g1_i1.p1 TRINITY_DN69797_c0_g1~~TRINITY_DN69797_c0_g1_i1.p1  ORF type:complete len:303 (+),score=51.75 TRINITY_DN69797_c0_g1_i1:172-1080(+)